MQDTLKEDIMATEKRRSSNGFWESFRRFLSQQSLEPGVQRKGLRSSKHSRTGYSDKLTSSTQGYQRDIEGSPMVDCPRAVKADGASHVQIVELGFSEKALGTIALAASTLAIGLAILAVILCLKSERESRLAQEDALFLKAALVAHGVQVDRHQLHKEEK